MNKQEILRHVDHTQLKAFATWEDIVELCDGFCLCAAFLCETDS